MWISRKAHEQLKTDLYGDIQWLRNKIETLEREVQHYVEYSSMEKIYSRDQYSHYASPKPIYSISLWEMIHAIREHLGLEISEVKAPKEKWKLVKKS